MDFFAELYADSDSESEEFLGFDLPDLEDSGDVFDEEEQGNPLENWEEGDRHVEPDIVFSGDPGMVGSLPDNADNPMDYFQTIISENILDDVVEETNRYASQQLDAKALKEHSRFHKWRVTNRGEILKFIAIVIAMSLVRQENLTDYWSNDPVTQTPFFPKNMARDRFLILLSFLHLNDNTKHIPRGAEGHDPLFKLGKPYTNILFRFSTTYNPHRYLSVDEGMVPWRGPLSFRVFNKMKPIKYGLKAYMLCDATNGYCCRFELYTGIKKTPLSEHGATYDIVMDLLRGRFGLGHVVFCDNYYSSPRLFLDLWELKVLAVGTCRKNRKGLPIFLKTKIVANQESFAMHTGPLTAVKYMDSNPVYILSTMFTSENVRHKDTVKPKCVKMYNKYMEELTGLTRWLPMLSPK